MNVLLPIDGSASSLRAIDHLLRALEWYKAPVEIHLLNVQHPLHHDVGQFVEHGEARKFHQEQGLEALAEARARLDEADIRYLFHVGVGEDCAETIVHFSREKAIDQIIMGTHGRSTLGRLLLGSVASEVVRLSHLPVTLVK